MRIGVVVNPIAGMGGRVGLKGTDGQVERARSLGATPRAPARARRTLAALADLAPATTILTYGGSMGEDVAREVGLDPVVVGTPEGERTSAVDTRTAVSAFLEAGVDLVLFVGGDGTAADVAAALEGSDVPMLGAPAGVKVYSSVFAVSPEDAGEIAVTFQRTEPREVLDIDEDAYRAGEVNPELRAVVDVPVAEDLQASKQLGGGTIEALVEGFIDDVEPGVTYVLGPGSTVGALKRALGFEGTPLGVDVWRAVPVAESDAGADTEANGDRGHWRGDLLVADASEREILDVLGDENVVVVSPIGGQGFVFGRGNHQISPAVIRKSALEIVASRSKLDDIGALRVDTDDPELDAELRGWTRVRVGRFERRMMQIV
ncbi:MAG: ATP-NAD kinase family protein [Halobacteriota archaeon]